LDFADAIFWLFKFLVARFLKFGSKFRANLAVKSENLRKRAKCDLNRFYLKASQSF